MYCHRPSIKTLFAMAIIIILMFSMAHGTDPIPFRIEIDKIDSVFSGSVVSVPVTKTAGTIALDGFDMYIGFDSTVMELIDVSAGPIFADPDGWEYFEYRFDYGNICTGCPTGFIRAIGLYDYNDGHDPVNQEVPDGTVLFTLNFRINDNPPGDSLFAPLDFFWMNCINNAISYSNGEILVLSTHVYDYDGADITDTLAEFPTYFGAPNECINPDYPGNPIRLVDYVNGGVGIIPGEAPPVPFEIHISQPEAILGESATVSITKEAGSYLMDGFDFLIGYDADAMTLTTVDPGAMFDDPDGWEYFEYRTGQVNGCDSTCPSGMIRIVGLFETNDGHTATNQEIDNGAEMFSLQFDVTHDMTYLCSFSPVSFVWADCGDNAIAYDNGDIIALSYNVRDYDGIDITDTLGEFPTFGGAPNECFNITDPDDPVRLINYKNGHVEIMCDEPIDDRGDINQNGVAYEIADYVLYSNYFLYGLSAFTVDVEAQTAASDINADGLTLTYRDFIYMIRIIEGNALPYPAPSKANFDDISGTLSIDNTDTSIIIRADFNDSLGGFHVSFYAPELQGYDDYSIIISPDIANMDVGYATSDDQLNIIVMKVNISQGVDSLSAAIPSGPVDIIEIIYTGDRPLFSQAEASGYMGEFVDMTVGLSGYSCGDADGSGTINILDIVCFINFLYKEGPAPVVVELADVDGNGNINILDAAYLIKYLYKSGPPPLCE